jgi:release factor glutamine methyltransferase
VASRNAARHLTPDQTRLQLLQSNWYSALADQQFDVIVANPPYIVAGDSHLTQGDLRFEPQDALTDHADGLSALRSIIDGAGCHLKDGGWLLMEHGYDQASAVRALLQAQQFDAVQSWTDIAAIERVSGGRHKTR